jgi:hypothetical protein
MSELATLQQWFTSILVRPGQLQDKILAADKTYNLNHTHVVRSSATLSGQERIRIYARGYALRLMECMRADYPALQNLLGEALFDTFAQAYLVRRPSSSPSLFDLGADFPAFLRASRPDYSSYSVEEQQKFDLPIELAQLERARAEVYRSRGVENIGNDFTQEHALFFLFDSEQLSISPCLRLLELQFPLLDFVRDIERGREPSLPSPKQTFVAIGRADYVVKMQELEVWQWHFLKALEATGNYMQAVAMSAQLSNLPTETILADLMLWIPVAFTLGYVYKK